MCEIKIGKHANSAIVYLSLQFHAILENSTIYSNIFFK